ncbi:MAG: hypothetical protein SH819_00330 [Cytophagales bacterium]|nr:hypothetical protein [Cytophagales bacterium]
MKTTKVAIIVAFCSFMLMPGCTKFEERDLKKQDLVSRLKDRMKTRDLLTTHALVNHYDQIGKDVLEFRKNIHRKGGPSYPIASIKRAPIRTHAAGIFSFVTSSDEPTLGIQDPKALASILSEMEGIHRENGTAFDASLAERINEKMNDYPRDFMNDTGMYSKILDIDGVTDSQKEVLEILIDQISTARDVKELKAINTTVEYEVINSDLPESDKGLILSVNSIFNHNIQSPSGTLADFSSGEPLFQKTAVVLAVVWIFLQPVLVGAVVGGAIAAVDCCLLMNSCNWDCISQGVYLGAQLGLFSSTPNID